MLEILLPSTSLSVFDQTPLSKPVHIHTHTHTHTLVYKSTQIYFCIHRFQFCTVHLGSSLSGWEDFVCTLPGRTRCLYEIINSTIVGGKESLCVGLVALVGRWERCLKARNLSSRRDLSPLSLFGFPREPPPPPPSGMSLSPSPSVLLLHRLLLLLLLLLRRHLLRYDRHHHLLPLTLLHNVPPRATMSSLSFYPVACNPGLFPFYLISFSFSSFFSSTVRFSILSPFSDSLPRSLPRSPLEI